MYERLFGCLVGLMKGLTIEPPPSQLSIAQKAAHAARVAKNKQLERQKIKQSHPQMSQLLSATSVTSTGLCSYSYTV
mgnify:FL=1